MGFRFTAQDEAELVRKGAVIREHGVKPSPELSKVLGLLLDEKPKKRADTSATKRVSALPTPLQGPCQSIWIPNWQPALLNKLMQGHWGNSARQKKADKQIVAFYFAQSGIPKATGPRRLSMMFVLAKGKRLFDRDAPWKSTKDALAACGALWDDTPALCVDGSVSYARALLECTAGTLLMLEDI